MLWIAVVALIVVFGGLAYIRATLYFWVAFAVLVTFGFAVIDSIDLLPTLVSSVIAAILILLCITPLRRKFISNPLFLWFKKSLVRPEYSCNPREIIMMESLNNWKFGNLVQFG